MEKITNCPVCNAFDFSPFLTCTDHTVSKKEFNIVQCKSCGFKFTNPRPDASELGAYYKAEEYISHTDTKQGLMNRLYHLVRKYTLIKKLQLILKLSSGSGQKELKILDIGCGTGAFLDVCKKAGMNSIGIEPDSQARQLAIEKYGLDVRDENAFLTLENDSFDVITLWHVLEHVPLLNEILIKIKELVKPNGRVVIAVPNSSSIDAKYYGKFWAAYDVPRHLYHFNPNDISAPNEF
jgi:2-polyprenyl-3-methyl-5-hydroxy-6-metoxy-1,4-benzoquinol methylase